MKRGAIMMMMSMMFMEMSMGMMMCAQNPPKLS